MVGLLPYIGVGCVALAVLSAIEHVFGTPCSLWAAAAGTAFALYGLLATTSAEGERQ